MRRILAVASLDVRRMWVLVGTIGIALGVAPTLMAFFLGPASPSIVFGFLVAAAGAAAAVSGFLFGNDFKEGKPSFFLARPLSTPVLLAGRIAAAIALAALAVLAFFLAYSLTGRAPVAAVLREIRLMSLAVVPSFWVGSLFAGLAAATSARQTRKRDARQLATQFLRGAGAVLISAFVLGLFADLHLRAYNSPAPVLLVAASYVLGAFVAACVAVDRGRTDRLRIARLMTICMYVHAAVAAIAVIAAWIYVLHPPPSAMREITSVLGSPDGRTAQMAAQVDRGGEQFRPFFTVNLESGEVERLAVEYESGWRPWLWYSRDGSTKVWAEPSPLLFGLVRRALFGASVFRFQASLGDPKVLRLPDEIEFDTNFPLSTRPEILPASGSDVVGVLFTIRGRGQQLAFVSPSRGLMSRIDLGAEYRTILAWAFRSSGRLRAAALVLGKGERRLQIVDVDPATSAMTTVHDQAVPSTAQVRFDALADRAILRSGTAEALTISLIGLGEGASAPAVLLGSGRSNDLEEAFLADGSVALIVRRPPAAELTLFSPDGHKRSSTPLGPGWSRLGSQPFANTVSVLHQRAGTAVMSLVDTASGAITRQVQGYFTSPVMSVSSLAFAASPLPGTPGARLLMSSDHRLAILPSISEDPRPLLPRP